MVFRFLKDLQKKKSSAKKFRLVAIKFRDSRY